ncbi:MAG: 23S rRNA (cytosine(2499)-C(5))-methyltransferase [Chloroflexi bacterium]|nr:MAG: 23S rRNA (cytosine(2499)-C(5))-methyltransferase [Chloroflexota bacterium]
MHMTAAAERAIRQGHPWVYDTGIARMKGNGRSGDIAILFSRKNKFLAVGLYDPHGPIRVRVLHQGSPATIDAAWWQTQLMQAAQVRAPLLATQTDGYRLVHGENDGFPGLVIDRYGQTFVMKLYTSAWVPHVPALVNSLRQVVQPKRIVLRLNRSMLNYPDELFGLQEGDVLWGEPVAGVVLFQENGLWFAADVVAGQKTGFFLDQRENRARVEALAMGKSVLNVFAYSGGFSLYAARGGATEVASLDMSEPALQAAAYNFTLNLGNPNVAAAKHELLLGDAFVQMEALMANGRSFDMVIIDPPAFAKKQAEVERALGAYRRLVKLGVAVLRPGGTLVMASCSSRVSAAAFFELVVETARKQKRPLRQIERTRHALDHPIAFAEGAYLKCLFAQA